MRRTHGSAAVRALAAGQHLLFALLLAIGVVDSIRENRLDAVLITAIIAIGLWYAGGALWLRPGEEEQVQTSVRRVIWLACLIALWLVLMWLSPAYAWLAFSLTMVILHLSPRAVGIPVVIGMTVVVIIGLWGRTSTPAAAIIGPVVGTLVAAGIVWGYQRILTESRERGRLVAELITAQADLESVQEELAVAQRDSGALAERARLARDIHDTLAQGYSSIVLLARAGQAHGHTDPELLARIEATAVENLEEARRVVHALSPVHLDDAPLPAAVTRLLNRLAEATGILTELQVAGDPRLAPTTVEVAMLRLIQGALANVRQHAHAERVVVTLDYQAEECLLDIVDDGVGFDPEQVSASTGGTGFGLRAMRERIDDLGGTLTLESAPGEGTAVAARIPLTAIDLMESR